MIDISLYPNLEGNLGENKVQIPDGVTTFWPEGDALVGNFIYKDGKLSGFVDTKALVENESKSTVMPYDFVDITLDKRLESMISINAGDRCKYLNVKYEVYLPKGYKKLEYLENPGYQFIDTELPTSNKTELRAEAMITVPYNGGDQYHRLYGNRASGEVPRLTITLCVTEGGLTVASRFGNQSTTFGAGVPNSEFYMKKYEYIVSNKQCGIIGGRISNRVFPEEWTCEEPCLLFVWGSSIGMRGRVYSFQMKEDGVIQRFFVPALDPTGAPCMYDIISQEPFYNAGTGQFLYPGAESQVATSDLDENFYAKKTTHGIQKLYHVPTNYNGTKDEYASENGFKQLVEPPMPVEGYWAPKWTETDTQLICNWVEVDAPTEI